MTGRQGRHDKVVDIVYLNLAQPVGGVLITLVKLIGLMAMSDSIRQDEIDLDLSQSFRFFQSFQHYQTLSVFPVSILVVAGESIFSCFLEGVAIEKFIHNKTVTLGSSRRVFVTKLFSQITTSTSS